MKSPRECKTDNDFAALDTIHKDFSLEQSEFKSTLSVFDDKIVIDFHDQDSNLQFLEIDRDEFEEIIDWHNGNE